MLLPASHGLRVALVKWLMHGKRWLRRVPAEAYILWSACRLLEQRARARQAMLSAA
jgi:hypothetical protein